MDTVDVGNARLRAWSWAESRNEPARRRGTILLLSVDVDAEYRVTADVTMIAQDTGYPPESIEAVLSEFVVEGILSPVGPSHCYRLVVPGNWQPAPGLFDV